MIMKGMVITSKGIEDVASLEIKDLINADCSSEDSCVVFDLKQLSDLCLLCYKCQSADRVIFLIGKFNFEDFFYEFGKFIEKSDFEEWLNKYGNFRVECIRTGTHDFKSVDVEAKAAEFILRKSENGIKLDLRNYGILFLVYVIDKRCYFGVDFAGFEINKRGYKIFLHPNSLRGTVAYAVIRHSGYKKKEILLDPFSRDGVIPIEAAFYISDFPHNYFKKENFAFLKLKLGMNFDKFFSAIDKKVKKSTGKIYSYDYQFKYVDYSRKNAKIAGVDKRINFSRVELEWLDIKFKERSVDRIVTNLPISKTPIWPEYTKNFFIKVLTY